MTENTNPQVPENTPDPGKIQDHFDLFQTDTYQDLFEYKKALIVLKKSLRWLNGQRLGTTEKRTLSVQP